MPIGVTASSARWFVPTRHARAMPGTKPLHVPPGDAEPDHDLVCRAFLYQNPQTEKQLWRLE
jgi:hypothetical protein